MYGVVLAFYPIFRLKEQLNPRNRLIVFTSDPTSRLEIFQASRYMIVWGRQLLKYMKGEGNLSFRSVKGSN